jgi:hypothetical protein
MSQTNPFGGFFAQDAGVQVPPGNGPYNTPPASEPDAAIVESGSHPSANTGYDSSGTAEYGTPVAEFTSEPVPVSNENVAQVQTDNDPANVSGPAPEVGLSDVYGAIQALDNKIDGLISSQSPWVQPQPDTDD